MTPTKTGPSLVPAVYQVQVSDHASLSERPSRSFHTLVGSSQRQGLDSEIPGFVSRSALTSGFLSPIATVSPSV